jgi:CDP-diacylglycerol---serine O-phosphatidyltransferase
MRKQPSRRELRLRKTLILLPNLITLSAIFCGFDSIRRSASAQNDDDFARAAILIVFAMFFDMLDGRVARMTRTQSAFGLQIDSIADVVSFGVAPALLVYEWTLSRFGLLGLAASFFFTACGAVRLARFNVLSMGEGGKPQKPPKYIVGLPIPGAAALLVALVVANGATEGFFSGPEAAVGMLVVTIGLGLLMVSRVGFRSFKDLKLNARTVGFVAFTVGSSALIGTRVGPAFVLLWLIGCYVAMGIVETLYRLPRRLVAVATARAGRRPEDPR